MSLATINPPGDRLMSDRELMGLYQGIEAHLPNMNSRIVQFVSCHFDEGANTVGEELAMFATEALGCPSLFVGTDVVAHEREISGQHVRKSLFDVIASTGPQPNSFSSFDGNGASYNYPSPAPLKRNGHIQVQPDLARLRQSMDYFRDQFKLIIVSTPGALLDPTVLRLGCLADGIVFVMEAERTRAPAAQQTLRDIDVTGSKVVGLVFNKRRYYIPNWLYRFL